MHPGSSSFASISPKFIELYKQTNRIVTELLPHFFVIQHLLKKRRKGFLPQFLLCDKFSAVILRKTQIDFLKISRKLHASLWTAPSLSLHVPLINLRPKGTHAKMTFIFSPLSTKPSICLPPDTAPPPLLVLAECWLLLAEQLSWTFSRTLYCNTVIFRQVDANKYL